MSSTRWDDEFSPAAHRTADSEYLTVAGLKDLGWTDGAIKRFLGEPDDLAPNPVYRTAAPMRRYLRDRAEDAMSSTDWRDWYEKSKARREKLSDSISAANEQKRQTLIAQSVASLETWFPSKRPAPGEIVSHWHEQKTYFLSDRGDDMGASTLKGPDPETIDDQTLSRWMANLLRHCYSNYDEVLHSLSGAIGAELAYHSLRREIDQRVKEYLRGTTEPQSP
jgi:hypothetical protein